MVRLYCKREYIHDKLILLKDREQIHYLCNVLRLRINDEVVIFDGQGNEYRCRIQDISRFVVRLLIKGRFKRMMEGRIDLTVACALPKHKGRFDELIDKLSQLGVNRIIPMLTERVIIRWDSKQRQHHYRRWLKIARQACIQSGRSVLPEIEPIRDISQVLSYSNYYDLKLIPTPMERERTLIEAVSSAGNRRNILVLIGPEGDFTIQELSRAKREGFISVSLGDLILRVDTAALSIVSFLRLYNLNLTACNISSPIN